MKKVYYQVKYFLMALMGLITPSGRIKRKPSAVLEMDFFSSFDIDYNVFDKWYSINTQESKDTVHLYNDLRAIRCHKGEIVLSSIYKPLGSKTLMVPHLYTGVRRFGFGYYEMIAKVPKDGKRWWPAFWLWGVEEDTWPPEIDIFEFMNKDSRSISVTNHWIGKKGKHKQKGTRLYSKIDLSEDYYSYGMLWEKNKITWFLGGLKIYSLTRNIPHQEMGLCLTMNGSKEIDYFPGERAEYHIKSLTYHRL